MGTASLLETGSSAPDQPAAVAAEGSPTAGGVECPLCGYDQAGALDGFGRDAWPMRGRCPECGLKWFWGDLLHPARQVPGWFAENPKRFAPVVLARTWRRALRPRRFWRSIEVVMRVNRGRVLLFALLAVLCSYGLAAVAGGLWEVLFRQRVFGGPPRPAGASFWMLVDWQSVAVAAAVPVRQQVEWLPPPLAHCTVLVAAWMLLMPLPFLALRETFMRLRVRPVHLLRIWAYSLAALPLMVLGLAAVRFAAQWVSGLIGYGYAGGYSAMTWSLCSTLGRNEWPVVAIAGIWLAVFWGRAASGYLRLPNTKAVVALMLVASFLAALAIAAYYPGSGLTRAVAEWVVW